VQEFKEFEERSWVPGEKAPGLTPDRPTRLCDAFSLFYRFSRLLAIREAPPPGVSCKYYGVSC